MMDTDQRLQQQNPVQFRMAMWRIQMTVMILVPLATQEETKSVMVPTMIVTGQQMSRTPVTALPTIKTLIMIIMEHHHPSVHVIQPVIIPLRFQEIVLMMESTPTLLTRYYYQTSSTPRGDDGTFDFDCDGTVEKQYTDTVSCSAYPFDGTSSNCDNGWFDTSFGVPSASVESCGDTSDYSISCSSGSATCSYSIVQRTQGCR